MWEINIEIKVRYILILKVVIIAYMFFRLTSVRRIILWQLRYCYHKYFCDVYADGTINVSVILMLEFDKTFVIIMLLLITTISVVKHVWNVMAHAQKPDFVFQRNWRVHLNWHGGGGCQFSLLLAAEMCASAVVMVVMLDTPCSEVQCQTTDYPLHSHVSTSLPLS